MKILLLNDNPVVNKLVTLSAQKTSDELEIVTSIDEIRSSSYDLLVVDDASYSKDSFDELNDRIKFSESLFISSRDTKEVKEFSTTIKKPFLPTDLVELFSTLSKKADTIDLDDEIEELEDDFSFVNSSLEDDTPEDSLDFDEDDFSLEEDEESHESVLDDGEAQKVKDLLDDTSDESLLEDELDFNLEDDLEDEMLLSNDDEDELEDFLQEDDENSSPVLDNDEAQKVKDLLDETSEEEELILENDLDDDLSLDEDIEDFSLEDEEKNELSDELLSDDDLEESFDLNDDTDLESQIETAVSELSDEDLNSEVNEETLLDIAKSEIDLEDTVDSLDKLTSKELKLAIGEEVAEDDEEEESPSTYEPLEENVSEAGDPDGLKALQKLLVALNDKEVIASMKGMKISINITLGDDS